MEELSSSRDVALDHNGYGIKDHNDRSWRRTPVSVRSRVEVLELVGPRPATTYGCHPSLLVRNGGPTGGARNAGDPGLSRS